MTGLSVMRLQDVWKRALEVVSRDVVARGAHFFLEQTVVFADAERGSRQKI